MDGPNTVSIKLNINIPESANERFNLFCGTQDITITCTEDDSIEYIDLGTGPVNKELNFTIKGDNMSPILVFIVNDSFRPFSPFDPNSFKTLLAIPLTAV